MEKLDDFLLFSGAPIQFKDLKIYQPRLIQIGELGEKHFYECVSYLLVDKDQMLSNSKDEELKKLNNIQFLILLIIQQPEVLINMNKVCNILFKRMLFIDRTETDILLKLVDIENKTEFIFQTDEDWAEVVDVVRQILCFKREEKKEATKPQSRLAQIRAKLKAGRDKVQQIKNKGKPQQFLTHYCSILATGQGIPLNEIIQQYTLIQLMNQMKRFQRYEEYKSQYQAMLQGAKIKKLTDWTGDLDKDDYKGAELSSGGGIRVNDPKK
jgi:hypothetical protein